MRIRTLVLVALVVLVGAGGAYFALDAALSGLGMLDRPKPAPTPSSAPTPSYVEQRPPRHSVVFVIGSTLAHGCPVTLSDGRDVVLTSRHVLFDEESGAMLGARWGEQNGASGELEPLAYDSRADLGVYEFVGPARPRVMHRLSQSEPESGEVLWVFGYDWETFLERPLPTHTVRYLAGHIIVDDTAGPGSSGSCILDTQGNVVGINSWHVDSLGVGPAVFGQWQPSPPSP